MHALNRARYGVPLLALLPVLPPPRGAGTLNLTNTNYAMIALAAMTYINTLEERGVRCPARLAVSRGLFVSRAVLGNRTVWPSSSRRCSHDDGLGVLNIYGYFLRA